MGRGPLTWIVGVAVGVVLVLGVTALIGNRDESGETVPAGEWAQNACGAVGVWRGELEAIVEDIRTPSAEQYGRRGAAVGDAAGADGLHPQGPRAQACRPPRRWSRASTTRASPTPSRVRRRLRRISDWADSASDRARGVAGLARRRSGHARGSDRAAHRRGGNDRGRARQRRANDRRGRLDSTPSSAAALLDTSTCQQLREETS